MHLMLHIFFNPYENRYTFILNLNFIKNILNIIIWLFKLTCFALTIVIYIKDKQGCKQLTVQDQLKTDEHLILFYF